MKKIISLVLSIFAVGFIFASARPSLDGRAVVCDEDELPKGLFAKTIGYLPGDSVTVTNPANGTTVDVLVLGSIDSSEGIAIMLSPEAADRLAIKKNSNVQVKITKRTGSLDENVSGTAVLAEENEASYDGTEELDELSQDYSSAVQSEEENADLSEETAETEEAAPVAENTESEVSEVAENEITETASAAESSESEVSEVAENDGETEIAETQTPVEENLTEEDVEETAVEAEPVSADSADEAETAESEDAETAELSEVVEREEIPEPVENSEKIEAEDLEEASDNVTEGELIQETPPVADDLDDSEKIEGEETLAPAAEENDDEHFETEELSDSGENEVEAEKLNEAEPESAEVGEVPAETEKTEEAEIVEAENPAPAEESPEKVDETAPESLVEEESKVEDEEIPLPELEEQKACEPESSAALDNEEEYAPIVLVPSQLNPPEEEKSENAETETSAPTEQPVAESEEPLAESSAEVVVDADSITEEKTAGFENFIKTEKELEKGKYYLQIATLNKKDNVQSLADKYAKKYPLVVIEFESSSYRVLIGPLTADEYGMIKERFVSYGFKDAFLRKIK